MNYDLHKMQHEVEREEKIVDRAKRKRHGALNDKTVDDGVQMKSLGVMSIK